MPSCKDPEIIGLDVQPPGDRINLVYSDTTSITAFSIREDSLRTDETSLQLLGSYVDSVFGRTDAAIYTQISPNNANAAFGDSTRALDSLVLTLAYSGYYGDTSTVQSFHVYRLSEDMSYSAVYYSDKTFSVTGELGAATVIPSPHDSVLVYGIKTVPHLRIKLDKSVFGEKLLALSGDTQIASINSFRNFFKGVYIMADSVMSGGAMLYFNLLAAQSKMTLYYHTAATDSQKYDFVFYNGDARMSHFNHQYSGTPVEAQLNNSSIGDSLVYVQSMAGVKTKIRFPHIMDYIKDGMIAVSKAEMEFTLSDINPDSLAPPAKLLLLGVDSAGNPLFLPDEFLGSFYYGGDYISGERKYKFRISKYLQNILLGKTKDFGLYLAVAGGSVQANRAIICGASNPVHKMKLNLFYTKPN